MGTCFVMEIDRIVCDLDEYVFEACEFVTLAASPEKKAARASASFSTVLNFTSLSTLDTVRK